MKQKIMEAILSAENNLSQEEISWAIRNIPNEVNNQTTGRTYDHTLDSVFEACGFTQEDNDRLKGEIKSLVNITPGSCKSQFIETVLNNASADLRDYLAIRGLLEIVSGGDPLDKLRDMLKKL